METWSRLFEQGIRSLARHDAAGALKTLERSLASCPPSKSSQLHRILYYTGIALQRVGCSDSAVRSWLSGVRIQKRGNSKRMVDRFTNGYGMAKQDSMELDDWRAFLALQLSRYLRTKNRHTFGSPAEEDVVREIIADSWRSIRNSRILSGKTAAEKYKAFSGVRIVFPMAVLPNAGRTAILSVDFLRKREIISTDRCPCGSGRLFCACCGRTPGSEELRLGLF
jgi:hypothetical protein